MKNKKKNKVISAFLGITMVASLLSPIMAQAEEESIEIEPPAYEEVKDLVNADEIVTANDIELLQGEEFDIKLNFTGLDITDPEKVKVQLYDAKDDQGNDFSTEQVRIYDTRYLVEPVSGNPKYLVNRKISVKAADILEGNLTTGTIPNVEKAEAQEMTEHYDPTTYTDPYALVIRNATPDNPDWSLPMLDYLVSSEYPGGYVGNHVKYIQDDGANGWRLAYCVELSKHFIDSTQYVKGTWESSEMYSELAYAIEHGCSKYLELNDSAYSTGDWKKDYYVTQEVLYCILSDYGYDGHSFESLSVANGNWDVYNCVSNMYADVKANAGSDGYGDNPVYEIVEPENITMSLSADKKYFESSWYSVDMSGTIETANIYLEGAPEGCEIVYEEPSKIDSRFYVRIPAEKAYEVEEDETVFEVNAEASFVRPYVYTYEPEDPTAQGVSFVEKYTESGNVVSSKNAILSFEEASVSIKKSDEATGKPIAGTIYGLYTDPECLNLLVELPPTNSLGEASVTIRKTQDILYLKEIIATKGYKIDVNSYNINLLQRGINQYEVTDEEQLGKLTIYKVGEVLKDANSSEENVEFIYQDQKLQGAVFDVYAAEDIKTPYGELVYSKDDLVAANLTTDESGSVTLDDLHLGSYRIKEKEAPVNYVLSSEEKIVSIEYAGQEVETVMNEVTFKNERQKIKINLQKVDKVSKEPLEGARFGLYAQEDIKNCAGEVIVYKDTLIDTVTTDETGKACFESDLPIGVIYYVKELVAPTGYVAESNLHEFKFEYAGDEMTEVEIDMNIENEKVPALPKTGDTSNAMIWMTVCGVAAVVAGVIIRKRKSCK